MLSILLLLAGFAVGVAPRSVERGGQEVRCGTVLLVAGAVHPGFVGGESAGADRDRLCAQGTAGARRITWGLLAAGVLVALSGWTALCEGGRTGPRPVPVA